MKPGKLALAFLSVALAACLIRGHVGSDLARISELRHLSYGERRIATSVGLRLDLVEGALDRLLPREQPVRLHAKILENDLLRQRFAEFLYPRPISADSPFELGPVGQLPLGEIQPGVMVKLSAPEGFKAPAEIDVPAPSVSEPAVFSGAISFLALTAAAIGLGLLLFSATRGQSAGAADTFLAASLVVCVAYSLASIFGFSLPGSLLPLLGTLGLIRWAWKRRNRKKLPLPEFNPANDPELYLFAAYFILLFLIFCALPAAQWDARSIWLFRAKELYFQGRFAARDYANPFYQWSHHGYPFLLPGWQAYFNALAPGTFSERSAALGLFVLFAAAGSLLWRLARASFGRWPGALLAGIVVTGISAMATGGIADGVLPLLLLGAYIGIRQDPSQASGWLALAAASLLKWEGLVIGAGIVGACLLVAKKKERIPLVKRGAMVFLPALLHLAWVKTLGLADEYTPLALATLIRDFFPRLGLILRALPLHFATEPFLAAGALAIPAVAIALALSPKGKRKPPPALLVAALSLAFVVCVFLVTPFDLAWHVSSAMSRVLTATAAFSLLALVEATSSGARRYP